MKKNKKKYKKTVLNPTPSELEEFCADSVPALDGRDYIGHPGPATTIAAHQRHAERLKVAPLSELGKYVRVMDKRKRK